MALCRVSCQAFLYWKGSPVKLAHHLSRLACFKPPFWGEVTGCALLHVHPAVACVAIAATVVASLQALAGLGSCGLSYLRNFPILGHTWAENTRLELSATVC